MNDQESPTQETSPSHHPRQQSLGAVAARSFISHKLPPVPRILMSGGCDGAGLLGWGYLTIHITFVCEAFPISFLTLGCATRILPIPDEVANRTTDLFRVQHLPTHLTDLDRWLGWCFAETSICRVGEPARHGYRQNHSLQRLFLYQF